MAKAITMKFEIHDNFDGSAHCVECGGDCRLAGAAAVVTQFIRDEFEHAASCKKDLFVHRDRIRGMLGPVRYDEFMLRARKTTPVF